MARRNDSYQNKIIEGVVTSLLKKNMKGTHVNNKIVGAIVAAVVALGGVWTAISSQNSVDEPDMDESVAYESSDANESTGRYSVPDVERVTIERCVDGDTLVVVTSSGVRERVRLIGANTPETVKKNWPVEPFGPEASAYTKRRVEEAGNVAVLVADGAAYDRYNRRLAFVFLGDDQVSLNEDLCRQGLAKAETKYSFSKTMKARLTAAAAEAEREGLGIYSLAQ